MSKKTFTSVLRHIPFHVPAQFFSGNAGYIPRLKDFRPSDKFDNPYQIIA